MYTCTADPKRCRCRPFAPRFWAKVDTSGECWLWQGFTNPNGYGVIRVGARPGKLLMTHRVSWELANGPIPIGLSVLHRCDTPLCVRPDHLWLGTSTDNNRDRAAKGRSARRLGEASNWSRLSEADVLSIRLRYAAGVSAPQLASEHGITRQGVWAIVKRRTWAHVA